MSIKGKAYVAGIYEHPTRKAPDKSVAQLHAECARGALADAVWAWTTWTRTSVRETRRDSVRCR